MNGIKNIVFDFGGVLVDISREQAVRRFQEIGVKNADNILGIYKQEGIFLALEEGKLSREDFYKELRKLTGENMTDEEIDYAWLGFMLPVQQERIDFLTKLKKKYRLFLLSNTNPIIMSWANSPGFTSAGKPLEDYFDKLYFSYQLGVIKPEKLIFEKMIQDSGINPSETLFIDDGKANVDMGASLGFKTYQPVEGEDYRFIFM
ncbi:MAG: HAD family phosphatase [Candidatus Azobacteroides sp.]|nr:HAD family phosphatase [Candidatus Azobacteroides sp.]